VYGASVGLLPVDEVHRADDRLPGRSSTSDLLHPGAVLDRSAVRVVAGKVDQKIREVPTLNTQKAST